jgi:hypothetical protein
VPDVFSCSWDVGFGERTDTRLLPLQDLKPAIQTDQVIKAQIYIRPHDLIPDTVKLIIDVQEYRSAELLTLQFHCFPFIHFVVNVTKGNPTSSVSLQAVPHLLFSV